MSILHLKFAIDVRRLDIHHDKHDSVCSGCILILKGRNMGVLKISLDRHVIN